MEIPEKYNVYIDMIKKYYKDRDMSHDYAHVEQVCKNALYIYHSSMVQSETDELIIVISALGHDIWDHKYATPDMVDDLKYEFSKDIISILNGITWFRDPFRWLLKDVNGLSDFDILDNSIEIIDNISLSNEYAIRQSGKTLMLNPDIVFLRNIVSDADKLESLGIVCLKRMVSYAKHTNTTSGIFRHIKDHCQDKLYKLLDDNYIITQVARNLALPRMQQLREIVDDDKALRKFISSELLSVEF